MTAVLLVAALACVCSVAVAVAVAGPATAATRRRELARRQHFLARHPHLVSVGDIDRVLRLDLPRSAVEVLHRRAHDAGVPLRLQWLFVQEQGATLLALALAAGCDFSDLQAHVDGARLLDEDSLRMIAELEGHTVPLLLLHDTAPPRPQGGRRDLP